MSSIQWEPRKSSLVVDYKSIPIKYQRGKFHCKFSSVTRVIINRFDYKVLQKHTVGTLHLWSFRSKFQVRFSPSFPSALGARTDTNPLLQGRLQKELSASNVLVQTTGHSLNVHLVHRKSLIRYLRAVKITFHSVTPNSAPMLNLTYSISARRDR